MNQQTAVIGPKRAVLYMRTAYDPTGSSVARQREFCREFAAEHGYTVLGAFADFGLAPGPTRRPSGYAWMVEHATAEAASAVIVTDLACISRRCTDYIWLRDELLGRIDACLADSARKTVRQDAR